MGRPAKSKRLDVCMNGELAGTWTITASGEHVFAYDSTWPDSPFSRPISISMVFTERSHADQPHL
jgi:serine/threonine-protein kinase HipA